MTVSRELKLDNGGASSRHTLYLNMAQSYADMFSGCTKVSVGSVIVPNHSDGVLIFGANRAVPNLCKLRGCLRFEKYGDKSKNHRAPSDCRAVHSEIDAICRAAENGISINKATIYVTRYPCEACARAIVSAGITEVYYGRGEEISEGTKHIFDDNDINYYQIKSWTAPDDNS